MRLRAHSFRFGTSALLLVLGGLSTPAIAQEPNDDALRRKQFPTVELNVTPSAAPLPLFRYRLHPVAGKLMPGNAAPIYLRIRYELPQEAWDQIGKNSAAWSEIPLDQFPVQEARKFVSGWSGQLKQIEIGTRREYCNWDYSIAEQRSNIINLMLPDAQSMRQWARLIAIKARLEIAEGNLDEAVHTIGTGIAFGRHVANGPFLINNLIGVAICNVMLNLAEEVIGRPDAPNLYWALTAIPRPLISIRQSMEIEQRLAENMIPEMNDVFASHSAAEWTILAERIYAGMQRLALIIDPKGKDLPAEIRTQINADYASFKKQYLEQLRITLRKTIPRSKETVSAMSDDEIMARGIVNQYRIMRDEFFKVAYLSLPDMIKCERESQSAVNEAKDGPAAIFATMQAAIQSTLYAEARLERRIAMLRTIEAIRLHAAANDGKLPESLDAIKEVPIPLDPATNAPFPFSREGDVAVLKTPQAGSTMPWTTYRIRIRNAMAGSEHLQHKTLIGN